MANWKKMVIEHENANIFAGVGFITEDIAEADGTLKNAKNAKNLDGTDQVFWIKDSRNVVVYPEGNYPPANLSIGAQIVTASDGTIYNSANAGGGGFIRWDASWVSANYPGNSEIGKFGGPVGVYTDGINDPGYAYRAMLGGGGIGGTYIKQDFNYDRSNEYTQTATAEKPHIFCVNPALTHVSNPGGNETDIFGRAEQGTGYYLESIDTFWRNLNYEALFITTETATASFTADQTAQLYNGPTSFTSGSGGWTVAGDEAEENGNQLLLNDGGSLVTLAGTDIKGTGLTLNAIEASVDSFVWLPLTIMLNNGIISPGGKLQWDYANDEAASNSIWNEEAAGLGYLYLPVGDGGRIPLDSSWVDGEYVTLYTNHSPGNGPGYAAAWGDEDQAMPVSFSYAIPSSYQDTTTDIYTASIIDMGYQAHFCGARLFKYNANPVTDTFTGPRLELLDSFGVEDNGSASVWDLSLSDPATGGVLYSNLTGSIAIADTSPLMAVVGMMSYDTSGTYSFHTSESGVTTDFDVRCKVDDVNDISSVYWELSKSTGAAGAPRQIIRSVGGLTAHGPGAVSYTSSYGARIRLPDEALPVADE